MLEEYPLHKCWVRNNNQRKCLTFVIDTIETFIYDTTSPRELNFFNTRVFDSHAALFWLLWLTLDTFNLIIYCKRRRSIRSNYYLVLIPQISFALHFSVYWRERCNDGTLTCYCYACIWSFSRIGKYCAASSIQTSTLACIKIRY